MTLLENTVTAEKLPAGIIGPALSNVGKQNRRAAGVFERVRMGVFEGGGLIVGGSKQTSVPCSL